MQLENFESTLQVLSRRPPFRPFTVELMSGGRFKVDHTEALVFRAGLAVSIDAGGIPTLFDHEGVSRLIGATDQAATA